MKTIEDLRTQIKEFSALAVTFSKKATELCLIDLKGAKQYRLQAKEAIDRCEALRQEIKRYQVQS